MKTKINLVTIFLIMMTVVMGGLSLFIALKLKEEKPATVPTQAKAANITYRKLIALNVTTPELPTPTGKEPTPTVDVAVTNEVEPSIAEATDGETSGTPTPTQIDLVTTPLLTSEPTGTELAYGNSSQEEEASRESKIIKSLPESGIYQVSLLIFFSALMLIFFSLIL